MENVSWYAQWRAGGAFCGVRGLRHPCAVGELAVIARVSGAASAVNAHARERQWAMIA